MSGQSYGQSGLAGDGLRATEAVSQVLPDVESGGVERLSSGSDAIGVDHRGVCGQRDGRDWAG